MASDANSDFSELVYARLSDGNTSMSLDCHARLTDDGIKIIEQGSSKSHLWPYDTLSSGEPLRSHMIDVLLSSSSMPGATLFVPDENFASALAARAPHLTARAERWRHASPWIVVSLVIAGLVALATTTDWSPLRTTADLIPTNWRVQLGESAIKSMTSKYKVCAASDGTAALTDLTNRLSKATGSNQKFKVTVSDWSLMNAFAVPGNQIVLTRGLIESAGSADELAGVLAHEMGHGVALHPETGLIRAIGISAAIEMMIGGTGGTVANLGAVLANLGYTRAAEHEADVEALRILRHAQISPDGLAAFFERTGNIKDRRDANDNNADDDSENDSGSLAERYKKLDLFSIHPSTVSRARLVREQPDYPATPALSEELWQKLKSICDVKHDAMPDKDQDRADTAS